jgi:hypothetical protein
MKTTVELPDSLLEEVRQRAVEEGTTVRALMEEGLRRILSERKKAGTFRLRKATYKGRGLQPDVEEGSWERIRDLIYEGRGA